MIIKTYITKSNTIIFNELTNTANNPVTELFYGAPDNSQLYSRFLFKFDESRLKTFYTGGTFTSLTALTHTLKLTNTGSFDKALLNGTTADGKDRASSFDLIVFKINQNWDEGVGYDYEICSPLNVQCSHSINPSNWIEAQTGIQWSGGTGVYSGSSSGVTIGTQHFDQGNEDINIDITNYVNGLLTGDTNYGLGIAYIRALEETPTTNLQYVGFFTNHTQTFYEPYVETIYSRHIADDRNNFFLDKNNKLYLYSNLRGNPTNLDTLPTVKIYDNNDVLFSSYTTSAVTHVTKGVYSIDIKVPTTANYTDCTLFTDVWSGITIGGIQRPNIELEFGLKDSMGYYDIGSNDGLPVKVGFTTSGIKNNESIIRGNIRKVLISIRVPYTVEQTTSVTSLEYRLYVKEGTAQLTVIDYQPVEMPNNQPYFLIDTNSLIPNTYYIDLKLISNLEVITTNEVITFIVVNLSELKQSK